MDPILFSETWFRISGSYGAVYRILGVQPEADQHRRWLEKSRNRRISKKGIALFNLI
jgi:hypothetical protein